MAEAPGRGAKPVEIGSCTAQAAAAPRIALSSGSGSTLSPYGDLGARSYPAARQVIDALGFKVLSERRSPLLGNRVLARLRTPANQTAEARVEARQRAAA